MPPPRERNTIKVQSERAVLAAVRLPDSMYDPADPFGELAALAEQAGAQVVGELSQNLDRPVAGTFMGKGKIEELKGLCERLDAATIIFDHDLAPKQLGNIEKMTDRKVIDRSELILDIFASRASTAEAKLQVELAQLEYTYPRLKAMWSHLERIVGAGGSASLTGGVGTRGPGEQQIEIDRRLVQKRKNDLQRELRLIQERKQRAVQERNAEHFTVGLVGYTNAGKSTLFNTLTAGGAYADDRLFATLMTRTRAWHVGNSIEIMLSDTVGFVRDLPHNLIASFRATLEEATHADLLLIVLDVADPAAEMHERTVRNTLDELFNEIKKREGDDFTPPARLLLLNKADRLKDNASLLVWQRKHPGSIPLCALPGTDLQPNLGQEELAAVVREIVIGEPTDATITLPMSNAKTLHQIETRATVHDRRYNATTITVDITAGSKLLRLWSQTGADIRYTQSGEIMFQPSNGSWGSAPESV
jgi:GTPase